MTPSPNGTKPKSKRPITIYEKIDCPPDQKAECDYKYLARVWFFRTLVIVVVSCVGAGGTMLWKTSVWVTQKDTKIDMLESRIDIVDNRVKKIEGIQKDLDTLKAWNRPK